MEGRPYPKPLQPVSGVPLIVRVLRGLEGCGVRRVAVVTGYLGDVLETRVRKERFSFRLGFIRNPRWHLPNGTSLLEAADFVRGPTLVLMSDHLWSPRLLAKVRSYPLGREEAVLGVDYAIGRCFDVDDATKVRTEAGRVIAIGKSLASYDALDTGVFLVTPALLSALRRVSGPNGCSLSEGVAGLAESGRMRAVDIGDASWIDIDTSAACAYAEKLLRDGSLHDRPTVPAAAATLAPVTSQPA